MTRTEMLMRLGYYSGIAVRDLKDHSYAERFTGKAETVTEADYWMVAAEIQTRLVAAGKLRADEDPWDNRMAESHAT
jgi:hypothetical protein